MGSQPVETEATEILRTDFPSNRVETNGLGKFQNLRGTQTKTGPAHKGPSGSTGGRECPVSLIRGPCKMLSQSVGQLPAAPLRCSLQDKDMESVRREMMFG